MKDVTGNKSDVKKSAHIFRNPPFAFEASVEDETENKTGVELQNTAMGKRF